MGNLKKDAYLITDPLRDPKHIAAIKRLLKDNPRNLLLFTIGINRGLRVIDIIQLKAGPIMGAKVGDMVNLREQKTGKKNFIVINLSIKRALTKYFKAYPGIKANSWLFFNGRGGHLCSQYICDEIKAWCHAVGARGFFGGHALRKTFGYHQVHTGGTDGFVMARRFNHSSPEITMRYLGITDQHVYEAMLKNNF